MAVAVDLKTIGCSFFHRMCKMSCVPHDLFRDATDVDAGTAEARMLEDGHARTVVGRPLGGGQPTAASS